MMDMFTIWFWWNFHDYVYFKTDYIDVYNLSQLYLKAALLKIKLLMDIHKNWNMEVTQVSIDGILFSLKKEGNSDTFPSTWMIMKDIMLSWNKLQKDKYCMVLLESISNYEIVLSKSESPDYCKLYYYMKLQ